MRKRSTAFITFIVGLAGVTAGITIRGPLTELDQDAIQYITISQNLAQGKGFKNVGPWKDFPADDRMPGWPAVLSIGMTIAPAQHSSAVARYTGGVCLALTGSAFALLTMQLGASSAWAILAALATSFSPPLMHLAFSVMSEVCFLMFASFAIVCFLAGSRWIYLGAMLFGISSLVRQNFVLVPVVAAVVAVLIPAAHSVLSRERHVWLAALCIAYVFPGAWLVRNYGLTGRIMFSSLEGETLYGSNNDVTANQLNKWGYWILPDEIPGETPKLELAKRMPRAVDLNDYYHTKGVAWIKSHPGDLPRLLLGKWIRAHVPVPWLPLVGSYVAFAFRFLLDVLYFSLIRYWRFLVDKRYLLMALSMFLVNSLTITLYWGVYRFTYVMVEAFFVPCIVIGMIEWRRRAALLRAVI